MGKQNTDALLKLALEQLNNIRPYKEDKAKHEALRHTLLSMQRVQQDVASEWRVAAQREISKARAECNANAAIRMGEICSTLSGDVLLMARDDAFVAASVERLSNASPYLKTMLQETSSSKGKNEVPVISAMFCDGRRVPVSSLTLILTALAINTSSSDLLPETDLYAIAEAISLCETWALPDVCQRIHTAVRAGRIAACTTSSDAIDALHAARLQKRRHDESAGLPLQAPNMLHQLWDSIAKVALDALSSVVTSTRCAKVLATLDVDTIAALLDKVFIPHELTLSGFPKENNSDLMDGVYIRLPDLHDGSPAWKRMDKRLERGVLFIYRSRGKWKISAELGGRVACAMLRSEAIPSCSGVQGPFWEIFINESWQERPVVKMKGHPRKPGSCRWSSDTCRLAWEWLADKVEYTVSTPLASLRAIDELGHRDTALAQRLMRNAAESNVLGLREELELLSTESVQSLLAQDELHTSNADELEVLRTALAFAEHRPASLDCLLSSVRLPFVKISRLRAELAPEDYKRLQECKSWHNMFEEAMELQLGKRTVCAAEENPRFRKRARFADIPQLSAAEVVALCNMGGS